MPPLSKSDIHTTSTTAALLSVIVWALGTYVFHGSVPAPVTGFVAFALPLAISTAAGYAARRRLLADARTVAHIRALAGPPSTPPAPPTAL